MRKIKDLKCGEFFTLKPIAEPRESQIYVRGEYDRSAKKYACGKFDDIASCRNFSGEKEVYTDFIF